MFLHLSVSHSVHGRCPCPGLWGGDGGLPGGGGLSRPRPGGGRGVCLGKGSVKSCCNNYIFMKSGIKLPL